MARLHDPDDRLGLLPAAPSHGIGSETPRPFVVVIIAALSRQRCLPLLPLLFPYFSEEARNKGGHQELDQ